MLELAPPDEPPPEGMLELLPPPDEPPELPPLGMLLLEPPELPEEPEEPDEPDEPPDEGLGMLGEGMLEDEDCCWAQPPIRNAEIAPTSVVFAAMTRSRLKLRLWRIAWSPVRRPRADTSQLHIHRSGCEERKRNLRLRS
jgi:hypothetical protein